MTRSVGAAVLASTLAFTTLAAAANNLFLKLDGISGESTKIGHQKEIDIESFSWGFLRNASASAGGGAGAGKPSIQDFSVVKRVDAASPLLVKALLEGKVIKNATFVVQKTGSAKATVDSIKITLENVQITDVKVSGGGSADATESVALTFSKLTYEYAPIDAKGTKGAVISVTWDVAKGRS